MPSWASGLLPQVERCRVRLNKAQQTAQTFVTALLDGGASFDDVMQVFIAPFSLADTALIRRCGAHSGIPKCCTEHLITKALPALIKGRKFPEDDAGYVRCPACRHSDTRVKMKKCNCFHFVSQPEPAPLYYFDLNDSASRAARTKRTRRATVSSHLPHKTVGRVKKR